MPSNVLMFSMPQGWRVGFISCTKASCFDVIADPAGLVPAVELVSVAVHHVDLLATEELGGDDVRIIVDARNIGELRLGLPVHRLPRSSGCPRRCLGDRSRPPRWRQPERLAAAESPQQPPPVYPGGRTPRRACTHAPARAQPPRPPGNRSPGRPWPASAARNETRPWFTPCLLDLVPRHISGDFSCGRRSR